MSTARERVQAYLDGRADQYPGNDEIDYVISTGISLDDAGQPVIEYRRVHPLTVQDLKEILDGNSS